MYTTFLRGLEAHMKDVSPDWVGLPKGGTLLHAAAHCKSATYSVPLGNAYSV